MLPRNHFLHNRYRIIRPLGKGGFGQVYEALDDNLDCIVAIKERIANLNSDKLRRAFEREAKLLANLRHPSLPKVSEHFFEGSGQYLVMEFIEGDDLATLLRKRKRPFPVEEVLPWADEVLKAVEYLHSRPEPIIHRDIKPSNIKLTDEGEIFLLDFGLAKGAAGSMPVPDTEQRSSSIHAYTAGYAPLEQLNNSGTNTQSDLYSLGATLYHLLTGQIPIKSSIRYKNLEHGHRDPQPLAHEVNPNVPFSVSLALSQAMAMSRRDRTASATRMRQVLKEARLALENQGALVDTDPPSEEVAKDKPTPQARPSRVTTAPISPAPSLPPKMDVEAHPELGRKPINVTPSPTDEPPKAAEPPAQEDAAPAVEVSWPSQISSENVDSHLASTVVDDEFLTLPPSQLDEEHEALERQEEERQERERLECLRLEEEAARRAAEEKRLREAEAERHRLIEEKARQQAEEAARLNREAEEKAARRAEEERLRREREEQERREAEAAALRLAEQREAARLRAEAEKARHEEESRQRAAAERQRLQKEEENRRQQAEEAARLKREAEARSKAEEEKKREAKAEAKRRVEEEARKRAEEETRRKEETQRRAEEEAHQPPEADAPVEGATPRTGAVETSLPIAPMKDVKPRAHRIRLIGGLIALLAVGIIIFVSLYLFRSSSVKESNTVSGSNEKSGTGRPPSVSETPRSLIDGQPLRGQQGKVWSVAYAGDGSMVAGAGEDGTVRLWDTASGELKLERKGHLDEINSVAFSPDSRHIASGSSDKTIILWSVTDESPLKLLKGHTGKVLSVAFAPDGKLLASASADKSIKLWDVETGVVVTTLKGHTGEVWSVAFSPDGTTLISAGKDQTIRRWEVMSGVELTPLKSRGVIYSLAFSPDSTTLASGHSDGAIRLWNWRSGGLPIELKGHTTKVKSIAFSPDGNTLASASKDRTIKLWSIKAASRKPERTLTLHRESVESVAFSPDSKSFVSGSQDQTVRIWNNPL